jgi:hypothetical protein
MNRENLKLILTKDLNVKTVGAEVVNEKPLWQARNEERGNLPTPFSKVSGRTQPCKEWCSGFASIY